MGRHRAPRRPFPMISVLTGSAGVLTVAALLGILETTGIRAAAGGSAFVAGSSSTGATGSADDAPFWLAGPLDIPTIGVVAPGFDEGYETTAVGALSPALVPSTSRPAAIPDSSIVTGPVAVPSSYPTFDAS